MDSKSSGGPGRARGTGYLQSKSAGTGNLDPAVAGDTRKSGEPRPGLARDSVNLFGRAPTGTLAPPPPPAPPPAPPGKGVWATAQELLARFRASQAPVAPAPGSGSAGPDARTLATVRKDLGKARKAFDRLAPAEQRDFARLYAGVGGLAAAPSPVEDRTADNLRSLLRHGILRDTDAEGATLLSRLAARVGQTPDPALAGRLDPGAQIKNLINMIAQPDTVYQGDGTATCVVASLEAVMARQDPAELARIATGLIWDGTARLHGTGVPDDAVRLDAAELGRADGRTTTEQVIQGSLQAYAAAFPPEGEEAYGGGRRGGTGVFGGGRLPRRGLFGGEAPGLPGGKDTTGLTEEQARDLFRHVMGKRMVAIEVDEDNAKTVRAAIKQALKQGESVPVGLAGEGGFGHQVTVRRQGDGRIAFQDSLKGGITKARFKRFLERTEVVLLPADVAAALALTVRRDPARPPDAQTR